MAAGGRAALESDPAAGEIADRVLEAIGRIIEARTGPPSPGPAED